MVRATRAANSVAMPIIAEADFTCLRAAARELKPGGDTLTPLPGLLRDCDHQEGANGDHGDDSVIP
jgi:hypothetical protein